MGVKGKKIKVFLTKDSVRVHCDEVKSGPSGFETNRKVLSQLSSDGCKSE